MPDHTHTRLFPATRLACALLATAVLAAGTPVQAQQSTPAELTLEAAIDLALRHNPAYRAQANDETDAAWMQREAYGAFLPSVSLSGSAQYQAEGTPNFGLVTGGDLGLDRTPAYYYSSYGINLGMALSGATLFNVAQQSANRRATEARVDAAGYTLTTDVTQQYVAALRAQDQEALAADVLATADQSLALAQARADAGAATRLDVSQAAVERGRAEVGLLQAQQAAETTKLRLAQQIGLDAGTELELTTRFEIFEPTWTRESLLARAMERHPNLISARAAEQAGRAASRAAAMSYLPSLQLNARWSGFSRQAGDGGYLVDQTRRRFEGQFESCQLMNAISAGLSQPLPNRPADCSEYVFTDAIAQDVLASNTAFPFDFSSQPMTFTASVSLPIVDGFTRERQVQTARTAAEDARYARRAAELARRTEVAEAHVALMTSYRTVDIEERNVAAASEQLDLARERYRLGAGSILELTQAQEAKARADQAQLDAIYAFYENYARLEAAVGERLIP